MVNPNDRERGTASQEDPLDRVSRWDQVNTACGQLLNCDSKEWRFLLDALSGELKSAVNEQLKPASRNHSFTAGIQTEGEMRPSRRSQSDNGSAATNDS
jgi:hypothetical protein